MGLKFSDALRLSWSNVAQHKKRSTIIILTISLLFSIITSFNLIASGLEKTIFSTSAGQTGGEVYLQTEYNEQNGSTYFDSVHSLDEISQVDLKPTLDNTNAKKIRDRAATYSGEVIGYCWYYQLDYPYRVITKSAVEHFIDTDLWENLPEDKIPTIMPKNWQSPAYMENLSERLGESLHRVGSIPSTELGNPTLNGFNPLNIILSQLPSAINNDFWLIDDGSGKVDQFIKNQLALYLNQENAWYSTAPIQKTSIVKFNNPEKAVAFASPDKEKFGVKLYTQDFKLYSQDLFGTTLGVANIFNLQKTLLIAIEVLLLIVATIIAIITFAHLIDQDAATVALYRAMGANTNNIYLIYFLYLVELCLLAIFTILIISILFIGLLALTSSEALSERLQSFYDLTHLPKITLFRLNSTFWTILAIVISVAPVSLLFTLRRFSANHIAKKLKEN